MKRFLSSVCVSTLFMLNAATAGNVESLAHDLAGNDERARVEARQLLPREGAAAVAPMIPLLAHENIAVSKAAYSVIWDVANSAAGPGHDAECAAVVEQLWQLIAPAQPVAIKDKGLRLLAVCVPEGTSLSPIEPLLLDPAVREFARVSLLRMNTAESARTLIAAIGKGDDAFDCALLRALGEMKRADTVDAIRVHLSHPSPTVRVAAAAALSWTGDPAYAPLMRGVLTRATKETAFDAGDAALDFGHAMALRGGNWQSTMAYFEDLYKTLKPGVQQGGAITAIGMYGDETFVPLLVKQLGNGDTRLRNSAKVALIKLQGPASTKAIIDVYEKGKKSNRATLLDVLGNRRDVRALPTLVAAAQDKELEIRLAAYGGLGDSALSEAMEPLLNAVKMRSGEERNAALVASNKLLRAIRMGGDRAASGRAYAIFYDLADSDAAREEAIAGLADFPAAEGYNAAMAHADLHPKEPVSARALVGVADACLAANQREQALAAYNRASALEPGQDVMQAIVNGLRQLDAGADIGRKLGFIQQWSVIGTFPWEDGKSWDTAYIAEPAVDLGASIDAARDSKTWKPIKNTAETGRVDLRAHLADRDLCVGYAYTEIMVESETDAVLKIGADDGIRIWLNGEQVFDHWRNGGLIVDEWQQPVHLKAGKNTILLKVSQNGMGWEFCLRLFKANGSVVFYKHPGE